MLGQDGIAQHTSGCLLPLEGSTCQGTLDPSPAVPLRLSVTLAGA
jgi:hypothetical protein